MSFSSFGSWFLFCLLASIYGCYLKRKGPVFFFFIVSFGERLALLSDSLDRVDVYLDGSQQTPVASDPSRACDMVL